MVLFPNACMSIANDMKKFYLRAAAESKYSSYNWSLTTDRRNYIVHDIIIYKDFIIELLLTSISIEVSRGP